MSNKTSLKTSFVSAVICIFVSLCFVQSANAGSIVSWGNRRFDSRDFENAQFQAIAAGVGHSIALKSDGSIVGCGNNGSGQASPPAGNDFAAIAAGDWHSLAIMKIYAGDFVSSYGVDFLDFAVLGLAWYSQPGDGNWNAICDISEPNDNMIDELDLEVFTGNWQLGVE